MICRVCEKEIGTYKSIGICWQCYKEEEEKENDKI